MSSVTAAIVKSTSARTTASASASTTASSTSASAAAQPTTSVAISARRMRRRARVGPGAVRSTASRCAAYAPRAVAGADLGVGEAVEAKWPPRVLNGVRQRQLRKLGGKIGRTGKQRRRCTRVERLRDFGVGSAGREREMTRPFRGAFGKRGEASVQRPSSVFAQGVIGGGTQDWVRGAHDRSVDMDELGGDCARERGRVEPGRRESPRGCRPRGNGAHRER